MRVTVGAEANAKSRLAAIRLTMLTLRLINNWRQPEHDYDTAMILVAVVAITSERLTRTRLEPELGDLRETIPVERLQTCNVSSIAAATGLNRETTRRKVKLLIEGGYLVRHGPQAVAFRPGILQEERTTSLVRRQLDDIASAVDDLLRDGLFTLK